MASPVQTDPTAVFGRRVVAALLDAALILIPTIMLFTADLEYLTAATLDRQGIEEPCESVFADYAVCADFTDDDRIEAVYFSDDISTTTLATWLFPIGIFVLLQGLTGWTIGKLLMGIRCVREDGRPPGILKALVRWLLWIVDGFPYFLPLVGFIVGLTTVGHRRVGDMAAKTFVVHRSAAGSPIMVPGLTTAPTGGWGAPPPGPGGATTGWGPAIEGSAAGWSSPTPTVATPTTTTPATTPQWDEARGTYIQWDPVQSTWMQWDEATRAWSRVPGQEPIA